MGRIHFLLFLLATLSTTSLVVGKALDLESIVGGDQSPEQKYNYHVAVIVGNRYVCGGGIIEARFILTAASCVIDANEKFVDEPISVLAGVHHLNEVSSSRVELGVDRVFIPDSFRRVNNGQRSTGNIAVLRLMKGIQMNRKKYYSNLEMPSKNKDYAGQIAIFTGFGANQVDVKFNDRTKMYEEQKAKTAGIMRYAEAKILSNQECVKDKKVEKIVGSHMCGQIKQRKPNVFEGTCIGDGGGPLVVGGDTVVGVLSTGAPGCREHDTPSIYTRVSDYLYLFDAAKKDNLNAQHVRAIKIKKSWQEKLSVIFTNLL